MEFAVRGQLPAHRTIFLVAEEPEWCLVQSAAPHDLEGYVRRDYIVTEAQEVKEGFLQNHADLALPDGTRDIQSVLAALPLTPPDFMRLTLDPAHNAQQQLALQTWNRVGGLLPLLCEELKILPGVAVAVLAIESLGKGFAANGKMIIRFENHIFDKYWGIHHRDRFDTRFRYNPDERWRGHQWRSAGDHPWQDVHSTGAQAVEWAAFEFARGLDDQAAKLSISMGAPQIMGFNHTAIGYESVQQMFEAFSTDERRQIAGFFDFIKGAGTHNSKIIALQKQDFDTFAMHYNGKSSRAMEYAEKMRVVFDAFQRFWGKLSLQRVKAPALNLRRSPEVLDNNILRADMPHGTRVEVLDFRAVMGSGSSWVKVRVEQDTGWVNRAYLEPAPG